MVRLSILDIRGKLVHEAQVNATQAQVQMDLPQGTYLLQVMAQDGMLFSDMLVVH
jgi:hypothetical protein